MKYLEKTWQRIIVSFLIASFTYEFISLNSNDPNHLQTPDNSSIFILIVSPIVYVVLTKYIKRNSKPPFKNLK